MASVTQEISIYGWDGENLSTSDLLILIKKTGYANVWINGKHYYWDERIETSNITNSVLIFAFNGGKSGEKKKKKKGKITITKK